MQGLLEKNPELRHALSDPSTLQSILSAASNPAAYNEMLRGHDRALSNLETMPEGFSHLKRVYSKLQEPMYEAMSRGRAPLPPTNTNFEENSLRRELPTSPVPNPWLPKQQAQKLASYDTNKEVKRNTLKRRFMSSNDLFSEPLEDNNNNNNSSSSDNNNSNSIRRITKSNVNDPFLASILFGQPSHEYSTQLDTLHSMGFTDDEGENLPALRACEGELEAAVEMIRVMQASRLDSGGDGGEREREAGRDSERENKREGEE